ncbi:hypothetical protein [Streptomyces sp. UNOC14_S4]|uniref:hypothetical protein n=1 Tax=Streptomyces sp. UNOC14_S4 TaxID=2872340 RepID=UPI001E45E7BE|nr:hypothetical protein [Streptomyces sp. UNOC14_S4]MCC3770132.1 hypothetical protein [Streptomyces sp. UNOC14_S4]
MSINRVGWLPGLGVTAVDRRSGVRNPVRSGTMLKKKCEATKAERDEGRAA